MFTLFPSLQRFCLLSANGDGSALTSKASSEFTILSDSFVRVIVSFIQTNRARCALYKKISYSLDEESVSGEVVVELVY